MAIKGEALGPRESHSADTSRKCVPENGCGSEFNVQVQVIRLRLWP